MIFYPKNNFLNKTLRFGVVVLFVFSFACSKRNEIKWVNYDETYCADAWAYSATNETLKQNLVDYFKTKSITIYELEIFVQKDAELSNTCTNKTGRVFKCKIKNHDLSEIKSRGFYE